MPKLSKARKNEVRATGLRDHEEAMKVLVRNSRQWQNLVNSLGSKVVKAMIQSVTRTRDPGRLGNYSCVIIS